MPSLLASRYVGSVGVLGLHKAGNASPRETARTNGLQKPSQVVQGLLAPPIYQVPAGLISQPASCSQHG